MSALLRLYPRSWRERYEREFLGLLEARPPSLGYGIVWILIGGTIAVRGSPRAAVEGPNAGSGG
jgi:hypothetical protein